MRCMVMAFVIMFMMRMAVTMALVVVVVVMFMSMIGARMRMDLFYKSVPAKRQMGAIDAASFLFVNRHRKTGYCQFRQFFT